MADVEPVPYRIRIGVTGHRKLDDSAAVHADWLPSLSISDRASTFRWAVYSWIWRQRKGVIRIFQCFCSKGSTVQAGRRSSALATTSEGL